VNQRGAGFKNKGRSTSYKNNDYRGTYVGRQSGAFPKDKGRGGHNENKANKSFSQNTN